MAEIIPAILTPDFKVIAERLRLLEGLAEWVQLDITDGVFAPGLTWNQPADLAKILRRPKLEVHLMVEDPEDDINNWCAFAQRVIIHHESGGRLEEVMKLMKKCGVESGVALLAKTPVEVVDFYVGKVDVIQLMAIDEIGAQGHQFDLGVYERIKILKAKYPDVKISVDGGVSLENASALIAAGADQLIVGSAIWQSPDPLRALRRFQSLTS